MADLDEAIDVHWQALEAIEANHPARATFLLNLGGVLSARYESSRRSSDASQAMEALQEASGTQTAPAFARLRAAAALGQLAASREVGSRSAVQGYQTAISLLPVLAWRGLDRVSRERLIAEFPLLASNAAACAIAADRPALAVELLEQGRAVLWSQLLETRSDLADLDGADHQTALRLRELRNTFDVGAEPAP